MKNSYAKRIRSLLLLGVMTVFLLPATPAWSAGEVVLNPGFISGKVQVGNEVIKRAELRASLHPLSSSTSVTPPAGSTSANYTLTVNVPAGTTPAYHVQANVRMDSFFDVISFPGRTVTVTEGQTSTADFAISNPGFIQGTAIVTGGGTLFDASISIRPSQAPFFTSITSTNSSRSGAYRVAVSPANNLRVSCSGRFKIDGQHLSVSAPQQTVNVAAGQTVIVNCVLPTPTPPATGTIAGNVAMPGPKTLSAHTVRAHGPQSKSIGLTGDGPYSFDVRPGHYTVPLDTHFNNHRIRFRHPNGSYTPATTNQRFRVTAGNTTQVDISSQQAIIHGKVSIIGSASFTDLNSLQNLTARGISNTPTQGGSGSNTRINRATGDYELILSEGDWRVPSNLHIRFFDGSADPAIFLNEHLSFGDETTRRNPITASANNPVTHDITLATGEVTITFRIAGNTGATMSRPILRGICSLKDANNQFVHSYSVDAINDRQQNVTVGSVRFFGMEGACTITASATVNSSNVTFGRVSVDVVPSVTKVVDVAGPTLTTQFPEPNLMTTNPDITVTGMVTDPAGIASVTVNTVDATLTSTNNPSDTNEVNFSATVPLDRGPNDIETVTTNKADPPISSSDTRTVFRDSGPPTLAWTPADAATFPTQGATTPVEVAGKADDDAGIKSIEVNGVMVAFQSTNNTAKPNEVSFTATVDASDGDNFIEVVAKDISMRMTTQTHKVVITINDPPTADAGADQVVEQQGATGSNVTLSGAASSDPDGDPLTFSWTGPFGTATGQTPTVLVPAGVHGIILVVNDGTVDSDPDTVNITVRDTVSPVITAPINVVAEAIGVQTVLAIGVATATDAVGVVSITNNAPPAFPIGTVTVTWTAKDAAGNTSTATQIVSVRDTTPPAVVAPASITLEATGPLTAVAIGTATATDAVGVIAITNNAPATFPVGVTAVTWSATDAAGNIGTGIQTVTIEDTTPPDLIVPADLTVEATGPLTAIDIGTATATDLVGVTAITNDAPATFPIGVTTVTWTATDAAGNASTAIQTVTVEDTTPPDLTAPAGITANATGPLTQVDIGNTTATDLVGVVSLTNDAPADGFPVDSATVVTWTAKDAAGNSSTATQTITIRPFLLRLNIKEAEVELHPRKPNKDEFEVEGIYIPFANGDGFDFATEAVTITLNGFSQTLPAGSFVRKAGDDDDDDDGKPKGKFVFKAPEGAAGIKKLEIRDSLRFEVKVNRIDIGVFANPADFSLRIGNDFGKASALFKIKSEKDDDRDKDKDKEKDKKDKKEDKD